MIRVNAASRLHFGVFSLPDAEAAPWLNVAGEPCIPSRQFGGVGLMVESPGLQFRLASAPTWSAEGPLADRALAFARQFVGTLPPVANRPAFRLLIERSTPEHVGLGSGTQLGLAVATALARAYGVEPGDAVALAQRVGRGVRSAIGVHGFAQGGFLVEAGRCARDAIAPLVVRRDFPEQWRIVLIFPARDKGLHGLDEREAFARLHARPEERAQTDTLCRLVLLGMLPALAEEDLHAFGEALYDFNRRVGELFRPVQGGVYAHGQSAEIVNYLRQQGIAGVGQSSWGPALFAVVDGQELAQELARRLQARFSLQPEGIVISPAANQGARVCC